MQSQGADEIRRWNGTNYVKLSFKAYIDTFIQEDYKVNPTGRKRSREGGQSARPRDDREGQRNWVPSIGVNWIRLC